jgi:hypothetical protein
MVPVASLAIGFAGFVHAFLAPEHYAHAPAHGLFFAFAAVVEIGWAYLFWRRPDERTYYAGLMIAGGLIVLWAGTRFIPAPFEHEVGEIDFGGIVCKISELVGLGALLVLAAQGKIIGLAKQSLGRFFAEAVVLSFFIASLTYVAAHDLQHSMPFLAGEEDHLEEGTE